MTRGIRDDMEKAFDKFSDSFEDDGGSTSSGFMDATGDDSDDDSQLDADHSADGGDDSKPPAKPGAEGDDADAVAPVGGPAEYDGRPKQVAKPKGSPTDSLKAPVNWGPKEREDWSRIPRHLQERILAREKDMASSMASTAEARKVHDQISNYRQTYGAIMAAEGVDDPMQAIDGMFRTVASLRMGTPAAKARVIADMINHYGIDIGALDDVLVGQEPRETGDPNMTAMQKLLDERLAPVNQLMQGLTAAQQNTIKTQRDRANREVAAFQAKAEFINEVRGDMADLIDMATKRGQTMTLQQAYDKACALNPEISEVLAARQRAGLNGRHSDTMAGKRAAASSLNGRKGSGMSPTSGGGSIREALLRSMDSVDRA